MPFKLTKTNNVFFFLNVTLRSNKIFFSFQVNLGLKVRKASWDVMGKWAQVEWKAIKNAEIHLTHGCFGIIIVYFMFYE